MKYDPGLILAEIEFAKPMRRPGGAPVGAAKPKAGGAWGKAANFYALSGGSKAVVLKKIHNGGCKTSGSLGTQVNYVFGKAERIFGSGVEHEPEAKSLTLDERAAMVKDWSEGWGKGRTPENGHTSHLLLSFPAKTNPEKAFRIAEAWAADMFDNKAQRGDSWSYMAALHIDRDHPHVHMIVKNKGRDEGRWFYMAQGATFDLKDMKQRVVELAAEAGLSLDASSRVERGILTYGPSRGEIEAARRQGREVIEKARTGAALHAALRDITDSIKVLSSLAGISHMVGDQPRRETFNAMRDALVGRKPISHDLVKEFLMETAGAKVTEFGNYVANWMVETQKTIDRLPPDRRAEVQASYNKAAALGLEAIGQQRAAELVKQAPQSALYVARSAEAAAQPVSEEKRANLQKVIETQARALGVTETIRGEGATAGEAIKSSVGRLAAAIGLSREDVEARVASGAPNALIERTWIRDDLAKVAEKIGRSMDSAEGRQAVSSRVDAFYTAATKIIAAGLALEVERDRAPDVNKFVKEWLEESQKAVRSAPEDKRAAVREQQNEAAALSLETIGQKKEAELARQAAKIQIYAPRSEADGAQRLSEGQRTKLQQVVETEARSLGVTEPMRSEGVTARDAVKSAVGRLASAVGLDREAVEGRIATGSPNALVERLWVKEDLAKVAEKAGRPLDNEDNKQAMGKRLADFYNAAARIIAVGMEREVDRDRNLSKTLGDLGKAWQASGKVQFANDENARDFAADMKSTFGPEVMREIASGKTDALARDIPNAKQREVVARAILSAAQQHEGMGITLDEANKGAQLYRNRAARGRDQGLER